MNRMMLMAAGLIAALSLTACSTDLTPVEAMAAESGGRQFAQNTGSTFIGCSSKDSDGDGYVTCTTSKEDLLCNYKVNMNSGAVVVGCKRK